MKKRNLGGALALVTLLVAGTAIAAPGDPGAPPIPDTSVPQEDGSGQTTDPLAQAPNCKKTYSSGSGASRFVWCFSNDGNIVKIEHSAALEHVRIGSFIEGFCLSSNSTLQGSSFGDVGNIGLNPPTYPSASKVQHVTSNGAWRIEQAFAQTTGTKTITVTMKLTNLSGVVQNSVFLSRAVDADMSNTTGLDEFISATRSVSANEPGSSRLELAAGTTNFPVNTMIYPGATPLNNAFCYDPASDSVNTQTGDVSMGVLQQLPNVLPGGSTTAKFTYQVSI